MRPWGRPFIGGVEANADGSTLRNCGHIRFAGAADLALADIPFGIGSGFALSLCGDVERVVRRHRSRSLGYTPVEFRFLLQLHAPGGYVRRET